MLSYIDLVNDMKSGCRPKDKWRIGIEHEQFVYNTKTGSSLTYDGAPGIRQILQCFIDDYGWQGVEKNGYLIELKRDGACITLEPGGQIELAGGVHKTVADVKKEADAYYSELASIAQKLGLGVMAKGFHPSWTRDQIHRMPKERYKIMEPYMMGKNKHGVDMMIRTCGAQINLDFSSEEDMIKKYRVSLGLQPVITALMANSNIVEGKESGLKSFRSFIWTETDPDRCGVPEFVFSNDMSFARYVDYALDVPMYFIIRDGHYINVVGQSFQDFMQGKLKGHENDLPTISDWHDHLTTLFPEVRLKTYLEFRGPDSAPPEEVYAMTAFWTGIFYDETALDKAFNLIRSWKAEDHTNIRNKVPRSGLDTKTPEGNLRDLGKLALQIAAEGIGNIEPDAVNDMNVLKNKLASL